MDLELPAKLQPVVGRLLDVLPLDAAMGALVVTRPARDTLIHVVKEVRQHKEVHSRPNLEAGLWLYIDDLDASHRLSQKHEDDATMNYWHAIMHRREGDFSNSKYWFKRAGQHPAMALVGDGYEPYAFVDAVAGAGKRGAKGREELVAMQRAEWAALFGWCAEKA